MVIDRVALPDSHSSSEPYRTERFSSPGSEASIMAMDPMLTSKKGRTSHGPGVEDGERRRAANHRGKDTLLSTNALT